jgi:hypothetical protein
VPKLIHPARPNKTGGKNKRADGHYEARAVAVDQQSDKWRDDGVND